MEHANQLHSDIDRCGDNLMEYFGRLQLLQSQTTAQNNNRNENAFTMKQPTSSLEHIVPSSQ
jgi:hypothetical protein